MSDCNKPTNEYEAHYILQSARSICVLDGLKRMVGRDTYDEYADRTVKYAHGTDEDRERISRETYANVTDRRTADEYLANLDTLRYAAVAVRPDRWLPLTAIARKLAVRLLRVESRGKLTDKRFTREVAKFMDAHGFDVR